MLRIHDIRTFLNQSHRLFFRGNDADAAFITKLLLTETDVEVSPPNKDGELMFVTAKGSRSNPLTRPRVFQLLRDNQYIELLAKELE